jgi:hypothetical protein
MTDPTNPNDPERRKPSETFSQQGLQHTPVGARVPEDVGRGVFANATMILQSHDEFVIDFLGTMVQPQQIVARVVLTPPTFAQLIGALRENVGLYESHFGQLSPRDMVPPPAAPAAPAATPPGTPPSPSPYEQPSSPFEAVSEIIPREMPSAPGPQTPPGPPKIEDLYDQLKLSDKILAGVFANMVMIRHMGEEFCLDFVANFYPRPVVTARVFMAAGRVPALLDAMNNAMLMFRQRMSGGPPPQAT